MKIDRSRLILFVLTVIILITTFLARVVFRDESADDTRRIGHAH